MFCHRCP
ncbi:hypothetical protein EC951288_1346A, partial [Escherichia coli 95.1288]